MGPAAWSACLLALSLGDGSPAPGPAPAAGADGPWLTAAPRIGWQHVDAPDGAADAADAGSTSPLGVWGLLSLEAIDHGSPNREDFDLDTETASLVVQGDLAPGVRLWLEPDLDGETTRHNLAEAWVEGEVSPDARLRAGQFRSALGSEFATRKEDLPMPGYAFPSGLTGRTDVGVRYDRQAAPDLWFELAATAGAGFDLEGERRDDPRVAARLVLTADPSPGRGFHGAYGGLGLAYSPDGDDPILLTTPVGQTVFTTTELDGDAATWLTWEFGYRAGPFRMAVENVDGSVSGVPVAGGEEDMDQLGAWSCLLGWSLRGDAPAWERGGWRGYGPADHAAGAPLPIELSFRYSNADIDRDLFDAGYASYATSSQETRTLTAALTAYASPDTRLMLAWIGTIADGEDNVGLPAFEGGTRGRHWVLRWDQWFGR